MGEMSVLEGCRCERDVCIRKYGLENGRVLKIAKISPQILF